MKKIVAIFLVCAMMLLLCACGGGDEPSTDCAHIFGERMIAEVGCENEGIKQTYCTKDCGYSIEVSVPAQGHNYVDGFCTVCDAAE